MFPSLELKLQRFEELERRLQEPDVLANPVILVEVQKEYGGLRKVAETVRAFHRLESDLVAAKEMLELENDPGTREYLQAEVTELEQKVAASTTELEDLATAGDAATRGGLIMEIRAGTGGDEAALFAGNLFNMYSHFIQNRGWKMELMDSTDGEMGGFKDITFSVNGEGAFQQLQFESGGHRVQRVPETESQGRVHTSAATVAVLPEATEAEINIRDEDLRIDTMRAGGPGGQKVNKVESAVRITHIPSGIVVKCQDEKSQHKNKAKAMKVLRSRLLEETERKIHEERATQRRTLIGSGDRSERIRTYNFPQGRLTDHRIGLTLYKLDQIIKGELDELIGALVEFDRQERLKGLGAPV
jgi:peptide chain release factor 1